jgi:hypothetical protein
MRFHHESGSFLQSAELNLQKMHDLHVTRANSRMGYPPEGRESQKIGSSDRCGHVDDGAGAMPLARAGKVRSAII